MRPLSPEKEALETNFLTWRKSRNEDSPKLAVEALHSRTTEGTRAGKKLLITQDNYKLACQIPQYSVLRVDKLKSIDILDVLKSIDILNALTSNSPKATYRTRNCNCEEALKIAVLRYRHELAINCRSRGHPDKITQAIKDMLVYGYEPQDNLVLRVCNPFYMWPQPSLRPSLRRSSSEPPVATEPLPGSSKASSQRKTHKDSFKILYRLVSFDCLLVSFLTAFLF